MSKYKLVFFIERADDDNSEQPASRAHRDGYTVLPPMQIIMELTKETIDANLKQQKDFMGDALTDEMMATMGRGEVGQLTEAASTMIMRSVQAAIYDDLRKQLTPDASAV